jgi:hypothetical protein
MTGQGIASSRELIELMEAIIADFINPSVSLLFLLKAFTAMSIASPLPI